MTNNNKRQNPEGDADPKVTSIQDMYLSPKRQCTAMSKHTGQQCGRYAMKGLRVCVMHGGATRQAKAKAAERIQQASGYAADLLVEMMANPDIDVKTRTQIAQDLLDRSGVNSKTILQIGVEQPKSFLDFVGDALVDVGADDSNIVDAVVIEDDDAPLVPRDPEVQTRFDRAAFAEVERARLEPARNAPERARMETEERASLAGPISPEDHDQRPDRRMSREEHLLAKEAGYNFSSRGQANRAAVEDDERRGKRRTRIRNGGPGES